MDDYKTVLDYIRHREATFKELLVTANTTDVPHLQGRARECAELLQELLKTKD